MTVAVGTPRPIRTLVPNIPCNTGGAGTDISCIARRHEQGDTMADLQRTVWTAPVRNLAWVASQFGYR